MGFSWAIRVWNEVWQAISCGHACRATHAQAKLHGSTRAHARLSFIRCGENTGILRRPTAVLVGSRVSETISALLLGPVLAVPGARLLARRDPE